MNATLERDSVAPPRDTSSFVTSAGYDCFWVDSFTAPGKSYWVNLTEETCSCPDHQFRHRECKHLNAVRLKIQNDALSAQDRRTATRTGFQVERGVDVEIRTQKAIATLMDRIRKITDPSFI